MRTSPFMQCACLVLLVWSASLVGQAAEPEQNAIPGGAFPATSILSDQKPASILVYNYYQSDTTRPNVDTEISITNSSDTLPVTVHLFFIRNGNCLPANRHICLGPSETLSFLMSDLHPNESGYIIAVAVDRTTGAPISHNFLLGSALIKLAGGQQGKLLAVGFAALYMGTLPGVPGGAITATLNFDDVSYNRQPRTLALTAIGARPSGHDTILVVNRVSGDLRGTVSPIHWMAGLLYDDAENPHSFSTDPGTCQFVTPLTDGFFPNTVPPFTSIIPAGQTGWMKFYESTPGHDIGLLGAALDHNSLNGMGGARNLKAVTLSDSNSLIIPIIPPPPACNPPVGMRADLVMNKTASPSPNVTRGSNITYTLTSTNNGPNAAFDVVIRDTLPPNTTFVSATPSSGGSCTLPPVGGPGTVRCTFSGTTGLFVQRSVTIVVNVNAATPSGTLITNTGETFSVIADPNFSNNARTAQSNVVPAACTYALTPTVQNFAASGGTGSFTVTTDGACAWTAVSNNTDFIIVTAPAGTFIGPGTVSFAVASHSNSTSRRGTITVGGQTFTVQQGAQFADVPPGSTFYQEIGKLSAAGITTGCGGGNFCPDGNVSRDQMAAFLSRALGVPNPPTPAGQRFADVLPGSTFYAFIEEMAVRQITMGCGGGNYCPTSLVTREAMAAFIIRALHPPGYTPPINVPQRFADVLPGSSFYGHIEEMAVRGITLGCGGGNYCPAQNVTRAQIAAFLVRSFGL